MDEGSIEELRTIAHRKVEDHRRARDKANRLALIVSRYLPEAVAQASDQPCASIGATAPALNWLVHHHTSADLAAMDEPTAREAVRRAVEETRTT